MRPLLPRHCANDWRCIIVSEKTHLPTFWSYILVGEAEIEQENIETRNTNVVKAIKENRGCEGREY